MVSGTISLSSLECFSPFPHGTNSLSVSREYLALPDGPGRFMQNYSCSALLRDSLRLIKLRIQDYHLILLNFPEHSPHFQSTISWPYYPYHALIRHRFGLFPVRSPLLGESLNYFLFLQVLRCFSSLRLLPYVNMGVYHEDRQVLPFGNPRIKDYLHLPEAYRSLSRPSSPPWA